MPFGKKESSKSLIDPNNQAMKIHIYILFLLALAWPRLASSQSPEALFQHALANNYELQALRLDYEVALKNIGQVNQLPQPELGVGVFALPVETRLGAQRMRIGLTQRMPWFGTLAANENIALQKAQIQYEAIAARELNLLFKIRQSYFQLYQLDRSQSLIRQNLVLLNALKSLSESKLSVGQASLADVLRVQLQIQELTQEIALLQSRKRMPLAEINQILARSLDTDIALVERLDLSAFVYERDSLLATIAKQHPAIRIYQQQQDLAQKTIALNQLAGKPSMGFGIDYITVDARSDAAPLNNGRDILQFRASVSIPIYRQQYTAKQQQEQLRIEAIEGRKNERINSFMKMIEIAFAQHEIALLQTNLYQQQIQTIQSTIAVLIADYQSRASGFEELLRMHRQLLDYELKLLYATVESQLAKAQIEQYLP